MQGSSVVWWHWFMGWRVNMGNFLLTVCAFGLLLSPAFAEEKSREQYREESGQIFGIEGVQKIELNRIIASGTKQRIGFFYALNPDCSASGDVNIRVTKQPEHGTAETSAATLFPNFEKENIRYKCNQHKVRGQQVNYKSAERYVGSDEVELLVLYPGGFCCSPRTTGHGHELPRAAMNSRGERYPSALCG
jgi:hypothetical protein